MNRMYGKLKNGIVEYAGKVIRLDDGSVVIAPKEADLLTAHYLPVIDEKPVTDETHYASPVGWEERDGAIRRTYEIREIPPRPPRTFSKLYLEDALFQAGLLDEVDAFIDAQTITNEYGQTMPLRRKYQTANDFSEAHPLFAQFKTALQQALGLTDAQVEKILESGVAR